MNNYENLYGILEEFKLALNGSELNDLSKADLNEAVVNLREMVFEHFELKRLDAKDKLEPMDEDDDSADIHEPMEEKLDPIAGLDQ